MGADNLRIFVVASLEIKDLRGSLSVYTLAEEISSAPLTLVNVGLCSSKTHALMVIEVMRL
jgi:hypothetical protein